MFAAGFRFVFEFVSRILRRSVIQFLKYHSLFLVLKLILNEAQEYEYLTRGIQPSMRCNLLIIPQYIPRVIFCRRCSEIPLVTYYREAIWIARIFQEALRRLRY